MAEIKATGKKDGVERSVTVTYDLGGSLADSITLFGENVVKSIFDAKATIIIQDTVRRLIVAGKTDEEIQDYISKVKFGVQQKREGGGTRKTAEQRLIEDVASGKVTPEQLQDIIKRVQAELAKKAGTAPGAAADAKK